MRNPDRKHDGYYFELFLKYVSYGSLLVIATGSLGYAIYYLILK